MVLSQAGNLNVAKAGAGKTKKREKNKLKAFGTNARLHEAFRMLLEKGARECEGDACVCPKVKVLIRQIDYAPEDITKFCNELDRYYDKQEYAKCFRKCSSEFLSGIVNRDTSMFFELPIAGYGINVFSTRDENTVVTQAKIWESR